MLRAWMIIWQNIAILLKWKRKRTQTNHKNYASLLWLYLKFMEIKERRQKF